MDKKLVRMRRILEDRLPMAQFKILCEYNLRATEKLFIMFRKGFNIKEYHNERIELQKDYCFYTIDKDGNMDRL